MDSKLLRRAYAEFFIESVYGEHYLKKIEEIIQAKHEQSEKDPDHARDYAQQARGLREAIAHIKSTIA